jgi:hypothetical protein
MSIPPREPTLATLLVDAIQSRLVDFRVALPCKIAKYNSSDGTVDVDILLKDQKPQPDGTVTLVTFPQVQDVPIQWYRCAGAWITLPLAIGDLGKLVFCDRSLSNWSASDKGQVVDPKSLGMHYLDGATFEPGLYPASAAIPSPDPDNIVIHTEKKVMIGEKGLSDDQRAAVSKLVKDEIKSLRDWAANHQHTSTDTWTLVGGLVNNVTTAPITPPNPVNDVAAQKVYVK